MQRIIIFICVFIALISCGRYRNTSVSLKAETKIDHSDYIHVLHDSARYGDTHAYSQCHDRYWEVFGEPNDPTYFEALTSRITIHEFDSITEILNKSFGKYTYDDKTAPIDSAYFWMGTKSYTKYYYWLTSDTLLEWGLFEAESETGYAHMVVYVGYNCHNEDWVQELEQRNPLASDSRYVSVYFKYDTIVNNYDVRGIFFPLDSQKCIDGSFCYDSGVIMYLRNIVTDKEHVYTDFDKSYKQSRQSFTSRNIENIIADTLFTGFKDGDAFVFHYNTTNYENPSNNLFPFAEFQFYDVDFDGTDELLIGCLRGGQHGCTYYEIYEVADTALIEKRLINIGETLGFDENTSFDSERKIISESVSHGNGHWGCYEYHADEEGNVRLQYYICSIYDFDRDTVIITDTTFYQ